MIKFLSKNPNDILEQLQKEICCLEEQIQQIISGGLGWALTGNVVSPTSFIGSTNLADFVVKTDNIERMRVLASGLVGVNTSSPTAPLDVNGQIRIRGGNPGAGKILQSDASGLATWVTLPPSIAANNGLSVNTGNAVLGQDINEVGDPAKLLSSRQIPMNGQAIHHTGAGGISIGYATPTAPFTNVDINGTLGVTQNLNYPTYGFVGGSMASFNLVHGSGSYGVAITRAGANNNGANLAFLRTWGANASIKGAVPPGNMIGRISFQAIAADNNTVLIGSSIIAWAATSPNAGVVKSYLTFPVTTDGGGQSGNRTIISSNANVSFTDSFVLYDPATGETDHSKLRLEQSLTDALDYSTLSITPTWNTTGTPTAIKMNITDAASNAASLLMDLQLGGNSRFKVSKTITDIAGQIAIRGGSPGVGKVLTSDAAGLATWENVSVASPVTNAQSGVRLDGTIVKLGGQLLESATIPITDATVNISVSGINTSSNSPTLSVATTGSGGIAIRGTATSGTGYGVMGVAANVFNSAGVYAQSSGPAAALIANNSTAANAIYAQSIGTTIYANTRSASQTTAIYAESTLANGFTLGSGTAIDGRSGTGTGVAGTTQTSGIGVLGASGSGVGIQGVSGLKAFSFEMNNITAPPTGVHVVGSVGKSTGGFVATTPGFGLAVEYQLTSSTMITRSAGQDVYSWTDSTDATRTARHSFLLASNGVMTNLMYLEGTGEFILPKYGVGTFNTAPDKMLGVTATGHLVEVAPSTGASTWDAVMTAGANLNNPYTTVVANGSNWTINGNYNSLSDNLFNVVNTGGDGIRGVGLIGVYGETNQPNGSGVRGVSGTTGGAGVTGAAFGGASAFFGNVSEGLVMQGILNSATTNTIIPIVDYTRTSSSAAGNGIGLSQSFSLSTSSTVDKAALFEVVWDNATSGNQTSSIHWSIKNNGGALSRALSILGTGQIKLDKYGIGTFNTIPDKMLGITATGNVVETPVNMTVVASSDALAQTATFTPITYNIPAGADVIYILSGFVNVTATDGGSSITHVISFTDVNNNARTITVAWRSGDGSGTAQSNTPGTTVQIYTSISPTFKAKAGTTVTVTSTLVGTPTWDSHYTLMKIR